MGAVIISCGTGRLHAQVSLSPVTWENSEKITAVFLNNELPVHVLCSLNNSLACI